MKVGTRVMRGTVGECYRETNQVSDTKVGLLACLIDFLRVSSRGVVGQDKLSE